MVENYIYKNTDTPDSFWYEDRKISLREYQKDLLFYWSGETEKAQYALYDKTPTGNLPTICSDGKFGSFSKLSSSLTFNGKNLESLDKCFALSFWLGANSLNGKYKIKLAKKFTTITAGEYSFVVQVSGETAQPVSLELTADDTVQTITNKLIFNLPPLCGAEVFTSDSTSITLSSIYNDKTMTISDGTTGTSFLTLFEIESTQYATVPTANFEVLKLSWGTVSKLSVTHTTTGKLSFLYKEGTVEKTAEFDWNNNGVDLDNIEVDIDSSVMYLFLNGTLKAATLISPIVRTTGETTLLLNGDTSNIYSFEEVIIKSTLQHKENFTPATSKLTKYTTTKPYIDFHYSGKNISQNSLTELVVNSTDNIDLVLNYKGRFYYYNTGAWRNSDGTYSKSNDKYTFVSYLSEFLFDGSDDLFVRVYFVSTGNDISSLEDMYFTLSDASVYGDEKETAAILIGEKELTEAVTLNGNLVVTTDQGATTITFENGSYTADQIVEKIKGEYPVGISSVYKDAASRLVLVSETKGDSSYIIASGTLADTLFGNTKSAQGKDVEKDTLEEDYEKFIDTVLTYINDDLIPTEVSRDAIRLYLQEAINLYKKYRSDEINTYKVQLSGNATDGYKIPEVITDWHDITDIIFRPLFPIGFYTGSFDNDEGNIVELSLIQAMCGKGLGNSYYGKGFSQDYYISLMNIQDLMQTCGLNPSWKVYNGRLFIFPNNISKYLTVTICYKAPIDPINALRDTAIIQYVAGKIRVSQSEIRGQYGGSLTAGSNIALTFNASEMYQRGAELIEKALESMKKEQEVLGWIYG